METLKEKCERLRSASDYRLEQNAYVLIMLDGRGFSKRIKNKFKKPFDDSFVSAMNETMAYLCENIQGCLFGFCQSDEISLLISDISEEEKNGLTSFFGFRLCKIQSIVASMATSKFNNLMLHNRLSAIDASSMSSDEIKNELMARVDDSPLYEFDCKAWNVFDENDAYAWFLYRQLDCIRNSKQQAAQTYLSHRMLVGKHTDEQIALLKQEKGIDWNEYNDGLKFGRMCYKELQPMHSEEYGDYIRSIWCPKHAIEFKEADNREWFINGVTKHDFSMS